MKKEKTTAAKKPALSWYKRMDFSKKTALWGIIFLLPWLIGLIFFLYQEDVKDQYLFFALILLLLS